jgi:hypothetical protein
MVKKSATKNHKHKPVEKITKANGEKARRELRADANKDKSVGGLNHNKENEKQAAAESIIAEGVDNCSTKTSGSLLPQMPLSEIISLSMLNKYMNLANEYNELATEYNEIANECSQLFNEYKELFRKCKEIVNVESNIPVGNHFSN